MRPECGGKRVSRGLGEFLERGYMSGERVGGKGMKKLILFDERATLMGERMRSGDQ